MASVIAFKPKVQGTGKRAEGTSPSPFTLLFFTGVRYERMIEDQSVSKAGTAANARRASRRSQDRLKA
jgi:hypothetical protein